MAGELPGAPVIGSWSGAATARSSSGSPATGRRPGRASATPPGRGAGHARGKQAPLPPPSGDVPGPGASEGGGGRGTCPPIRPPAHRGTRRRPCPAARPLREADDRCAGLCTGKWCGVRVSAGSGSALGAVTMEAFGMDSSGRPLAPGSESSRYARHRLSHAPLSAARRLRRPVPRWAPGCCGPPPHRRHRLSIPPPRPIDAANFRYVD